MTARPRPARPRLPVCGIALALAALAAGCGQKHDDDVRAFVQQVRSNPVESIEAPPKIAAYKPFGYHAGDKRSPFQPAANDDSQRSGYGGPRPDPARRRGPLEQYALDALAMMGTVTDDGVDYALVRTPDGVIYRVRAGQYLGQHSGEIVAVTNRGLTLREIVPKSAGGYQKRNTTITVGQ